MAPGGRESGRFLTPDEYRGRGASRGFLLIVFLSGTPVMLLLLAWSIRYAIRGLAEAEPPA
jgi:hypothetical protein